MPEITSLTEDQRAVVECAVDSKTIVTAGPGTGKTHTLVSRIEYLIAGQADIAGQDVLSLSFSRAAVGELRRRVAALPNRGSRVRSATFDSFATRLLQTYGDGGCPDGANYDRRIQLATELLNARTIDDLIEIRHILVDEAQDLTDIRANFVLKLIEVTDSGFTVFADQAQAIYGFSGVTPDAPPFVERVMSAYANTVETLHLTTNHRTNDAQLLAVAQLGDQTRDSHVDRARVIDRLDRAVRSLPSAGSLKDAAWMLQGGADAAILTRRNSDALAVSQMLYNSNVQHQLRRRADDPVIGSWLSRLQNESSGRRVTLPDLEKLASSLPWTPEMTWSALSRAVRPRKGVLNLNQIAEELATRMPPDELLDSGSEGVVVSSIHRAKGLEFDTVLLVPFEIDEYDWLDEARVMYVALTRARRDLMTLQPVDDRHWSYVESARRWCRVGFAGKRRYTTGIEISGMDAFTFDPTGATRPRRDAATISEYLLSYVRRGDPVVLERHTHDSSASSYDVVHDGLWVATTTSQFGEIITRQLGLKVPPTRIEGCRVEAISTVALTAPVAELYDSVDQLLPNCRIQGVGTWA